jgi:methionyl-tRNA formyltransferase
VTLPFGDGRVKVLRGRAREGSGPAGEVLRVDGDGVEVAAGRGSYVLEEVQPPGRRPQPARVVLGA